MTTTPTVLLIPGMLNDETVWLGVAAALGDAAQVRIAMPVQASITAMAQAAWAQLADLPLGAPVVVAGFSLGGYVAIDMLARPQRPLHAAALLSTSSRPESAEGAAVRERSITAMQQNFEKVVDGVVSFGTHNANAVLADRLRRMMVGVGAETAIAQQRAIAARSDHRSALAALTLPRPLAVMCGAQDRITPPELARETAALIPDARLEIVDGSGHMLPCERPDAVLRTLLGLLH